MENEKEPILENRADAIHLCEMLYGLDKQMLFHFLEDYSYEEIQQMLAHPLPLDWLRRLSNMQIADFIRSVGYDALNDDALRQYALFLDEYERNCIEYLDRQYQERYGKLEEPSLPEDAETPR